MYRRRGYGEGTSPGRGKAKVDAMKLLFSIPLLALGACADYALESKVSGDNAAPEDGTDDADVQDTGTIEDTGGGADTPVPDGWVVEAQLALAGGVPVADGATIRVDFVEAGDDAVACTVEIDPTGVAGAASPDASIWAWWEVVVVPEGSTCSALPETIGLGVGELHPDARARLGAAGRDDVADSLFGAYVRVNDGPLWVYGYAGTEGDLAGDDVAADPPPDGVYALLPLYVLPLP